MAAKGQFGEPFVYRGIREPDHYCRAVISPDDNAEIQSIEVIAREQQYAKVTARRIALVLTELDGIGFEPGAVREVLMCLKEAILEGGLEVKLRQCFLLRKALSKIEVDDA